MNIKEFNLDEQIKALADVIIDIKNGNGYNFGEIGNKITEWSDIPSDYNYPSEKLVKETINNIGGGEVDKIIDKNTSFKTYYVNNSKGSDDNDGLSKSTAFKTIEKAFDMIPIFFKNDYEIIVSGEYNSSVSVGGKIACKPGVGIYIYGESIVSQAKFTNGFKIVNIQGSGIVNSNRKHAITFNGCVFSKKGVEINNSSHILFSLCIFDTRESGENNLYTTSSKIELNSTSFMCKDGNADCVKPCMSSSIVMNSCSFNGENFTAINASDCSIIMFKGDENQISSSSITLYKDDETCITNEETASIVGR